MRLRCFLVASAFGLVACGGQDAHALANRACRTLDELTGVVPPGDKSPRLEDVTADAKAAAQKDDRFAALSSAVTEWATSVERQLELTRNGFKNMTASETAELEALNKITDGQFVPLSAQCKKAKAAQ